MKLIDLNEVTVTFDYANDEADDIKRCLETLYQTPEGTCPLDREFGLKTDFLSAPAHVVESQFTIEVIAKTDRYEPRATVKSIRFAYSDDGQLRAEVIITNV